jgi:hypothetical protein
MEKHKATRNTAFTSAPSTSALAQPNVFLDHFFGDICKEKPLLYTKHRKENKNYTQKSVTEVGESITPVIAL